MCVREFVCVCVWCVSKSVILNYFQVCTGVFLFRDVGSAQCVIRQSRVLS